MSTRLNHRMERPLSQGKLAVLVAMGMCLYWLLLRRGQINLIFSNIDATTSEMQRYYLGSVCLVIVLAIIVLVLRGRASRAFAGRPWIVLLACIVATATNVLLLLVPFASDNIGMFVLKTAFFALSFLALTYAWGALIIENFSRPLLLALAVSFLLSTLVTLLDLAPEPVNYLLPVLGPLLSGVIWFYCHGALGERENRFEAPLKNLPIMFILLLVIFLLLGGIIRGFIYLGNAMFAPSIDSLSITVISTIFSLFIIGMILLSKQRERFFNTIWVIFAIIYFAGLFLLVLSSPDDHRLGNDVIIATRTCFNFFLFAVLASGAHHEKVSPLAALSIFALTEASSSLLSYLIVPMIVSGLGVSFGEYLSTLSLVMALALIVCSFFFLTNTSINQASRKKDAGTESSITDNACERLAIRFDLTEREREVCVLLSQGHNYKKIGAMLYIAPNTVLAHTRKIYQKMDIHSKQDLIDLVNSEKTS